MDRKIRRIAITGGPGAGKTSVWRAITAAHPERVVAVPEVATLMFQHVFPQVRNERERRAIQRSIFHVQQSIEAFHEERAAGHQVLLCDRGTPDGGGYWPDGPEHFFETMQTDWRTELGRYEAVLFLQTAAAGGHAIAANNPTRTEDLTTAIAIDTRLHEVWRHHPNFLYVPQAPDLTSKLTNALKVLEVYVGEKL